VVDDDDVHGHQRKPVVVVIVEPVVVVLINSSFDESCKQFQSSIGKYPFGQLQILFKHIASDV
jgi:hypothetical protein